VAIDFQNKRGVNLADAIYEKDSINLRTLRYHLRISGITNEFLSLTGGTGGSYHLTGSTIIDNVYSTNFSASTIYSGSTNLYDIFLTSAYIPSINLFDGINTYTANTLGGTSVNVTGLSIANISVSGYSTFNNVYATSVTANTISGNTIFGNKFLAFNETPLNLPIINYTPLSLNDGDTWISYVGGILSLNVRFSGITHNVEIS